MQLFSLQSMQHLPVLVLISSAARFQASTKSLRGLRPQPNDKTVGSALQALTGPLEILTSTDHLVKNRQEK